jgi:hypothetical protein
MKQGRIPSNQVRGYRKIFTAPVTQDNQQFQVDLPRGAATESALVVVDAKLINITVGFASIRDGAAAKYVNRVDWVLNGNITLDSITGYGAFLIDKFFGHGLTPNTNPASFNVSTPNFRAVIPLHRIAHDFTRPKDSVLKTDENVTTNQLRVQLGALSNLFVGAGTANYAGATVNFHVYVADYQEAPDANGRTPVPLYYWKRTEQLLSIASIGTGIPFRVNTGNRLRGLILMPQDSVNSEPSTGVLSRARIVRSGDMRVDLDLPGFQPVTTYANPTAYQTSDSTLQAPMVLDFANPLGLTKVSRYSECWPVPSNADVQLQVDSAALGTIRMLTVEGVDLYPS